MKKEYRKHFCGMFSVLALYSCLLFICLAFVDIFLVYYIKPIQMETDSLESVGYHKVIVSNALENEYSPVRKLDNIITFSYDSKKMNANTYICSPSSYYRAYNLSDGEIAISKKMADRLHLTEGDIVKAEYSIYDHQIEYSVKEILPYASDAYDVRNNQDFSYAIIGYDDNLTNKASGKYVYFMDDNQYADWMNRNLSYDSHYDIEDELVDLNSYLLILYGIYFVVMIVFIVIVTILMRKAVNSEILKYYYEGYPVSVVKLFDRLDVLIFNGIPILLQIIFIIFAYSFDRVICILNVAVVVFLLMISVLQGGMKYVKANNN